MVQRTLATHGGRMLDMLHRLEARLPELCRSLEGWRTVDVDYHPPRVERLVRDVEAHRLYLHVIHPCAPGQALLHPHPWPSAIRVLEGVYEMGVGHGPGETPPRIAARLVMHAPFEYEMLDPDGWHWVRPIGSPSLSVMVTGTPWDRWAPRSDAPLGPIAAERAEAILAAFAKHYPARAERTP